jgi:hypothetical protein
MEHKKLNNTIDEAINNELLHARGRFSDMASGHEGYAIILEEFEELQDEFKAAEVLLRYLWFGVKRNDKMVQKTEVDSLIETVKRVITEAVQVAAMCKRFQEDVLRGCECGQGKS